jgi:hypothetical protein
MSDTAWADDRGDKPHPADGEAGDLSTDDSEGAGISGEAARSAFDALFADGASGWGSAFLDRPKPVDEQGALINSVGVEGAVQSDSRDSTTGRAGGDASGDDEESEKPKRKRSRRRRRGGKGRRPAAEQVAGEAGAEGQTEAGEQSEAGEQTEVGTTETPAGAIGSPEELGETGAAEKARRPRRSRSRRGTRPAEAKDSGVRPPEVKDNRVRGQLDGDDDDDDLDDDLDGDLTDDDLGENGPPGAARGRKRHSNLPTWSDAIGMIVDANLEQRAKSPSKPQSSRGRGGRGGGGRRRSSKRPESK